MKRARISKIEAAEALLSFCEVSEQVDTDTAETLLSLNTVQEPLSYQSLKKKDAVVQTKIALEHMESYSTECLLSTTEMKKCIFMKNVANDTLHYTGKKNVHNFLI